MTISQQTDPLTQIAVCTTPFSRIRWIRQESAPWIRHSTPWSTLALLKSSRIQLVRKTQQLPSWELRWASSNMSFELRKIISRWQSKAFSKFRFNCSQRVKLRRERFKLSRSKWPSEMRDRWEWRWLSSSSFRHHRMPVTWRLSSTRSIKLALSYERDSLTLISSSKLRKLSNALLRKARRSSWPAAVLRRSVLLRSEFMS